MRFLELNSFDRIRNLDWNGTSDDTRYSSSRCKWLLRVLVPSSFFQEDARSLGGHLFFHLECWKKALPTVINTEERFGWSEEDPKPVLEDGCSYRQCWRFNRLIALLPWQWVLTLFSISGLPAAKALKSALVADVGDVRLPLKPVSEDAKKKVVEAWPSVYIVPN